MQIEIVKVEPVQNVAKGNNVYQTVDVAFKSDGKVQGKKLVSFNNKNVFDTIVKSQSGDTFDVMMEKKDKFWNWVAIAPASKSESSSAAASSSYTPRSPGKVVGSNYETPAERERRQLYIGRQAALNTAISYYELLKAKPSVEEVVDLAGKLESWVRRPADAIRLLAEDAVRDMTDDIPTE